MCKNCEDNSEQLRIFWIMVESIIALFYIEVFKHSVKIRLKDQFIQKWHVIISQGGKCKVFRIIKISFGFESYSNNYQTYSGNISKSRNVEIIACP